VAAEERSESPWLLAPILSSDPKLGTNAGGVAAYLHRFDEGSDQSMFGLVATYSNTDSYVAGVFGDMYFGANRHRLQFGWFGGNIRNDYEDFLGTGRPAKTEDDLEAYGLRYLHRIAEHWYLGGLLVSGNYAIGADGALGDFLEQIGLTGFDSTAVGLALEYDDRDHIRNPTRGKRLMAYNLAFREALGGDESFDVYQAAYSQYLPLPWNGVLAVQAKGRWTDDAPLAGYSSVQLRGYTLGNYLARHYSHIDLDGRIPIRGNWGLTLFAGVGCLYASLSDCGDDDRLYPAIGAGISYLLKPEAGIVLRAEYAKGDADNEAFYLRFGHPF
jgi:hypothetical protein